MNSPAILNESTILDALRQVIDPEIGCNIVDLGLIYSVAIAGARVKVTMTLTTPGCPMHESLCGGVQAALLNLEGVDDAEVELVWEPLWHPVMMTEIGRAQAGVRNF
jgi:metal-sulfur cluster biosynthetic enzyme